MHQIDEVSKGRASYASTQREWHGLGEMMTAMRRWRST